MTVPLVSLPIVGEPIAGALAKGFFGASQVNFNISQSSRHAQEVRVQIVCDRSFPYFEFWFSSSSDGLTVSGWFNVIAPGPWVITPSALISAGAPFVGTVIQDIGISQTAAGSIVGKCYGNASGVFDLFINDPGKAGNFFVAVCPQPGLLFVSRQILAADFSA